MEGPGGHRVWPYSVQSLLQGKGGTEGGQPLYCVPAVPARSMHALYKHPEQPQEHSGRSPHHPPCLTAVASGRSCRLQQCLRCGILGEARGSLLQLPSVPCTAPNSLQQGTDTAPSMEASAMLLLQQMGSKGQGSVGREGSGHRSH